MIKVLQIAPNFNCEFDCFYCSKDRNVFGRDMSTEEIKDNIDYFIADKDSEIPDRGINELVLSGGEITARDDFAELIEHISQKNLRLVTIITNGKLWDDELIHLCRNVVDRCVVAFSFVDDVAENISNILSNGIKVQTNTVILKQNVNSLPEIAQKINDIGIKNPIFTLVVPSGKVVFDIDGIVPLWGDVKPNLFETIDILKQLNPYIKNVPPCYLGDYIKYTKPTSYRYVVDWKRQKDKVEVVPPCFRSYYSDNCESCLLRPVCDGFWKEYLTRLDYPALGLKK